MHVNLLVARQPCGCLQADYQESCNQLEDADKLLDFVDVSSQPSTASDVCLQLASLEHMLWPLTYLQLHCALLTSSSNSVVLHASFCSVSWHLGH